MPGAAAAPRALRRCHQAAALLVAALGLFLVSRGIRLGVEGNFGPGAGFFPVVIGAVLASAAALWLLGASLGAPPAVPEEFATERRGVIVVAGVVLALAAFTLALEPLGFRLAMLALLIVLLFESGPGLWPAKLAAAVGSSFGLHYVFTELLRVPLPAATLAPLRALGL